MRTSTCQRHLNCSDKILSCLDELLYTVFSSKSKHRPNPSDTIPEPTLTPTQNSHSGALMRINHTGEVCAQALYLGQSWVSRQEQVRVELKNAADEEVDHLCWCQERINELNGRTSYLNTFWFGGSLLIGIGAGLIGDKVSLGFLHETETQVGKHLESHLHLLPKEDTKSRAIVQQMLTEELEHAQLATNLGAAELPPPIKWLMQGMSKIMTSVTYYL